MQDVDDLFEVFGVNTTTKDLVENGDSDFYSIENSPFKRTTPFMEHPVFNTYHSETKIVRYMKSLENKDVSLVHSMIPLVGENQTIISKPKPFPTLMVYPFFV